MSGKVSMTRVENSLGDGVDVAGLAKIEDTGKNVCSAWGDVVGAATPPTVLDAYNLSFARTSDGRFTATFDTPMDNDNYSVVGTVLSVSVTAAARTLQVITKSTTEFTFLTTFTNGTSNALSSYDFNIQIFGGKA